MKLLKIATYCGLIGLMGTTFVPCAYAAKAGKQDNVKELKFTEGPTIRILLAHGVNSALLEVKGPYKVHKLNNGALLSFGNNGKRFVVHPIPEGLRWGEEYPDIHQIIVKPDHPETMMYVNGIQYKGAICVYQHKNKVSLVNEVDVEDYIKSTLGLQFNSSYSKETMAALAISARTNAYYQLISHPSQIWHITAEETNYQGCAMTCRDNGVDEAVDFTKYMVMENVSIPRVNETLPAAFATTWTEHSAGKTAPFHVVFKQDKGAPKEGVASPIAAKARDAASWSFSISKEELAAIAGFTKIDNVLVVNDKESGKVQAVKIQSGTQTKDIDFFTFQEELGSERLQSNDFKVIFTATGAKFTGYGKGHGVGLCLYSAEQMAQKGFDARRILYTFYPNTKITVVNKATAIR